MNEKIRNIDCHRGCCIVCTYSQLCPAKLYQCNILSVSYWTWLTLSHTEGHEQYRSFIYKIQKCLPLKIDLITKLSKFDKLLYFQAKSISKSPEKDGSCPLIESNVIKITTKDQLMFRGSAKEETCRLDGSFSSFFIFPDCAD